MLPLSVLPPLFPSGWLVDRMVCHKFLQREVTLGCTTIGARVKRVLLNFTSLKHQKMPTNYEDILF